MCLNSALLKITTNTRPAERTLTEQGKKHQYRCAPWGSQVTGKQDVFLLSSYTPPGLSIAGVSKARTPQTANYQCNVAVSWVNLRAFHANCKHWTISSNGVHPPTMARITDIPGRHRIWWSSPVVSVCLMGGRGRPNKWRRSPLGRLHSYTPHYPLNHSLWGRAQFLGSANHWQKQLENHLKDLVLLEKKRVTTPSKTNLTVLLTACPWGKKRKKKSTDRGSKEEQRTDLDSTGLSHPHRQTATTIKQ